MRKKDFSLRDNGSRALLDGSQKVFVISHDPVPSRPKTSTVTLPKNTTGHRSLKFEPYYGQGYDAITSACQRVIERLRDDSIRTQGKAGQLGTVQTVYTGFKMLASFCALLRAAVKTDLTLDDLHVESLIQLVHWLKGLDGAYSYQANRYNQLKALLTACHRQGYWQAPLKTVFPVNPFPNSHRKVKGQAPLTKAENRQLVKALKMEFERIYSESGPLSSYDLTVCVLGIGISTGLNPTPLLELPTDCLQPHPLKSDQRLLVSFKRRSNKHQVTSLRQSRDLAMLHSIKLNAANAIEAVIERNAEIRERSATPTRLMVYESTSYRDLGATTLASGTASNAIEKLVKAHDLRSDKGEPMVVNLSRLRKTFVNRLWELSGQDPLIAARHGKHTPETANRHYWQAPREAEDNMRLLGEIRLHDLLSKPKENTPVAGCKDLRHGDRAPKDGSICTEVLGCFRCRSFVVTPEDLYRLFSFYWAVVRGHHDYDRPWRKYLRRLIRLIDEEVATRFDPKSVAQARERAQQDPHPFWRDLTMARMA